MTPSLCSLAMLVCLGQVAASEALLPSARPLEMRGDIAELMIQGIHSFLDEQLHQAELNRFRKWQQAASSKDTFTNFVEQSRMRLRFILGMRDALDCDRLEIVFPAEAQPALAVSTYARAFHARWRAFEQVHGEGLLLVPQKAARAIVVLIPDADQSPEQLAGLVTASEGKPVGALLAASGCVVIIPVLINRQMEKHYRVTLTNREYIYRPAFELGRHIIGYELLKILAAARTAQGQFKSPGENTLPIAVAGWGEGGMLALYAAAIEPSIDCTLVSGYFGTSAQRWREPIDRNVFGLLELFGDAEVAAMIVPRTVIVEAARAPEVEIPPGLGGAPGRLQTPPLETVRREKEKTAALVKSLGQGDIILVETPNGAGEPFNTEALHALLRELGIKETGTVNTDGFRPNWVVSRGFDYQACHARQLLELERHNQWALSESEHVRRQFCPLTDTFDQTQLSIDEYLTQTEKLRRVFYEEVIGRFDLPLSPPNARCRKYAETDKWIAMEVVLDVFPPHVIAYGILLKPKGLKPGEKRPVVVCQHGLEGRPQDVISGDHRAYHDFAAKLASKGFVVFAPQNPYIFGDRFRTLQRKANLLGKTLFSVIVLQHQQILNWLKTLPFVDGDRIAFYGLSYGGKTAMRVPALLTDYCLSICSADFNNWIWKNAATDTRGRYSYVFTGEYEIFEFNLGNTFNYAEMAALIAPRPFMVERGHLDRVAPDEMVAYEFAKVRYLYTVRLGLPERCEIEWFLGPHTIHGEGTFRFLEKHLASPGY